MGKRNTKDTSAAAVKVARNWALRTLVVGLLGVFVAASSLCQIRRGMPLSILWGRIGGAAGLTAIGAFCLCGAMGYFSQRNWGRRLLRDQAALIIAAGVVAMIAGPFVIFTEEVDDPGILLFITLLGSLFAIAYSKRAMDALRHEAVREPTASAEDIPDPAPGDSPPPPTHGPTIRTYWTMVIVPLLLSLGFLTFVRPIFTADAADAVPGRRDAFATLIWLARDDITLITNQFEGVTYHEKNPAAIDEFVAAVMDMDGWEPQGEPAPQTIRLLIQLADGTVLECEGLPQEDSRDVLLYSIVTDGDMRIRQPVGRSKGLYDWCVPQPAHVD